MTLYRSHVNKIKPELEVSDISRLWSLNWCVGVMCWGTMQKARTVLMWVDWGMKNCINVQLVTQY